ncbi:LRR receptor-like serine/threonine-protein kinase FLS2 [Vigna unguiculata]|uniref:LRR receptor-like serine/threonine-protein kinase FLS2 n=1 Tax=Vigna unguiculata TaxID=3917 RepID=A0A4D6LZR7_VIGUN|nr:LRR receptor-like serine/threonine-protein kinase FLS2 [Vigna unguiculata]
MLSNRISHFCVATILCILLCHGSSHAEMCVKTEKQALLKLKEGFVHGMKLLSSWNGDDCCRWKGVSCNNLTGHVTSLDLRLSNFTIVEDLNYLVDAMPMMEFFRGPTELGGNIDSSICELQHLTFLDLSHNYLQGEIPTCIGLLGQLTQLKLAWNGFNSVPCTLSNLSNLQYLDLGKNDFVVSDLDWLSHLSSLTYLDLSKNNLGAVIDWPSSISKIPFLSELYLNDCRLTQVNPKSISHLNSSTFLQILGLSGNNFGSSIMSWVVNVSKVLTVLDLSHNELDNGIIKSFNTLCHLKKLYLGFNKLSDQLSGYLPEFCSAKDLEVLNLDHNPFSNGSLPDFSLCLSLERLSLQNTSIVGPLSFGHLPHLKALDLSLNGLNGSLPVFEDTKFAYLVFLDLSHNKLSGTLPYTIGQLSNLWFLSISSNELKGNISEKHILNLSGLKIFDVSKNSLSFNLDSDWVPPFQLVALYASSCNLGPQFPMWLKQQRKLQVLQISNTYIMDSFPEWFGDISSSLLYINVSHNNLRGILPKSLSGIKTGLISTWDFSFNHLSGPLPSFPLKVYELFLSNNMFTGFVSSFCETSSMSVTYLDLSSNALTGLLPNCWQNFPSLEVLNLANNSLSGRVSESFGNLQNILSMHLNNNNFSGEVPSLTLCKRSLRFIDFGDNNLEGTLEWLDFDHLIVLRLRGEIPQCIGHISAMSDTEIQRDTIFYGTSAPLIFHDSGIGFVSSFCETSSMSVTYLDLSSNALTGLLPNCWQNFPSLEVLNLANNSLSGRVSESFGNLQNILSMHLNNNNFSGEVPSLTLCKRSLRFIDFGDNNLEGTLEWLDFDHLIVLRLRGNRIRGSIPTSLCNMLSLKVLDLSSNNITGEIPQCIGHISAMSDTEIQRDTIFYGTSAPLIFHDSGIGFFFDRISLTWKGRNYEMGRALGYIKSIDISNNNLTGEIPESITSLVALATLNLSRNNLIGLIPDNIGRLKSLESIDLSRNHFHGRIPISFSNLNFVGYMNLSFNNFSGMIPLGTQLQSFDVSCYVGNIGLCGLPLKNRCPDVIPPRGNQCQDVIPPRGRIIHKNEDKFLSFEFYLSMGLGFGVGFWGVCGTLIVKSSWRRAYFHLFINVIDWMYVRIVVFTARMKRRFQIQDPKFKNFLKSLKSTRKLVHCE